MTEINQKRLYEHYLKLVENPTVRLVNGESRAPGSIDKDFIVNQAKRNIAATLKVYPHFADKKEEVKKEKK